MHRMGGLDVATALFSSAPGGMADMALISAELGAETAYVGILQMFRILVIILTMPPLFKKILQKRGYRSKRQETTASADMGEPKATVVPMRLLILLFIAAVGGLFFRWLGVTAGALTGGMLASAVYCVLRGTVKFPSVLKFLLQILAGAYIGIGIDRACVSTMPNLLAPALIMVIGIYGFVFVMAWLMHRLFKLDLAVCLLSSTPGGVQEMSLLSEDLGADTAKIAVMQTVRLVFVILLFPTMLGIIARLFSS